MDKEQDYLAEMQFVASMQEGHRKPVYVDALILRGLIGRTGIILGCRALVAIITRSIGGLRP